MKNNLKQLRFDHNRMSQEALAQLLQVSRQTVNSIENGKFNPSVKLALKMAAVFNCRVEDIFYLEEEEE
ncbi:MAG: transcriptional regulator [Calditrichaeota bacterium]|nr:MAG: transcriptional regulator [Calditrichota bacterium]